MTAPKGSNSGSTTDGGTTGGKLAINPETCTGCSLCVLACPVDVIRMDPATAKPVIAYPLDCQVCYLCEDDCPTQSISLSHDISNSRRYSTYDEFGLKV
jgi:formate hydrogenlyase subunit 6/NADH:ubiquinone oxidoreductase subunit I